MTLHRYLTRLIWLCILPLLLVAAWLAVAHVHHAQNEDDTEARHIAQDLVTTIDHHLTAQIRVLEILAQSPLADQPSRWPELYQQSLGFRKSFGSDVIFADPARHTLFNTRQPFGAASTTLPQHAGRSAMLMALQSKQAAIGDVFLGPVTRKMMVGVAVPGLRNDKAVFVMGTTIDIEQFQRHLEQVALPAGWSLTLQDGTGSPLARRGALTMVSNGEGAAARRYAVKSTVSHWTVVLKIPQVVYLAPLLETTALMIFAILAATLAGVLGGRLAGEKLTQAVASLSKAAGVQTSTPDIAEFAAVRRLIDASLAARDRAETAQRDIEQRFRATFEQASVGIALTSPDGPWLMVNQKLCDIVGYTRAELLAKTFQDITHPDDLGADLAYVRQTLAHEIKTFAMEKRYRRKNGSWVWVRLSCAMAWRPDGSPDYFISLIEDIQDRKLAEEKLRMSDMALKAISQGVIITDAKGHILSANEAFLSITGYPLADMLGRTCGFVQGPLTHPDTLAAMRQARVNMTEFNGEIVNYRKDGTPFWNELSVAPVNNAQGVLTHFIGITRDVTERHQLQAARDEALDRLQKIASRLPGLVYQYRMRPDGSSCLPFANDAIQDIYRVSAASVREDATAVLARIHPDDFNQLLTSVQQSAQHLTPWLEEYRVRFEDGTVRWLLGNAQPQREDDGGTLWHGFIADITERRLAEVEQKRVNRALRLLSDSNVNLTRARHEQQLLDDLCRLVVASGGYLMAWVGVAEHDTEKTVRMVAQFGDGTGYLDELRLSWDDTRANGHGPTGAALRTGTTQVIQNSPDHPRMALWREAILKRGYRSCVALPLSIDGQVLCALTLFSVVPHGFGDEEVGLLEKLAGDMAYGLKSLRARSELERYRLQLEELVAQRTQEIAALNTELVVKAHDADQANLAKSAFLATMSHELRTPLNAVVGLAGLLAGSPLDRRQRDYADKIQLSAQALRALIDDILDFSKIEAGELRLEQTPFSLNAILRTTAAVMGASLNTKPVEAFFDVAPDVPDALVGDALRLQQVLLNLTGNAVKFTETGVIVVSVRCLACEADRTTLQFAVRDTGIGIPEDQLRHIFDVFAQGSTTTTRLYGGSGLGLAISTRLARLMGGRIAVESTVAWGSEFCFTVPLTLGQHDAPVTSDDIPADLKVLIIDDHAWSRQILMQSCAAFGWQATALDSGAEGLQALRHNAADGPPYDLLLLDWRMPGMDGLTMLRLAYATPDACLPLVILMASMFELEQAVAASDDVHIDGITAKPITPNSLLDAVTRAFSGDVSASLTAPQMADGRLSGMRLLVAEDNELNQEVIEQILIRAGAEVVLVAHGLAAVQALRDPDVHFDAVLMDIQMPVMDGYTATRVIRDELGRVDLPIIAVTAFARPEDREKSRLAGMVGHVVKPLNLEDLLDILHKTRQTDKSSQPSQASGLKSFGGDPQIYASLLQKFITHHGGDAARARHLFNAGDTSGATHLIHDLRGMAGILQARELTRLTGATEDALRSGQRQGLSLLFDNLEAALLALGDLARLTSA